MSNDQREDLHAAGMLPKLMEKAKTAPVTLPSRFAIGDTVTITARVAGVQFSGDKVRYAFDLGPDLSIVDSEHIQPRMEVGKD